MDFDRSCWLMNRAVQDVEAIDLRSKQQQTLKFRLTSYPRRALTFITAPNLSMPPRIPSQRTLRFIPFNASPFVTSSTSRHAVRTLVTHAPSCLRERRSKLLESPVVDQVKRFPRRVSSELVSKEADAGVLIAC